MGTVRRVFGIKTPKVSKVEGTEVDPEVAEAEAEEEAQRKAAERRKKIAERGQASTVKTGLMGLLDKASTKKKTLLGG